jgi:hypothetical protein
MSFRRHLSSGRAVCRRKGFRRHLSSGRAVCRRKGFRGHLSFAKAISGRTAFWGHVPFGQAYRRHKELRPLFLRQAGGRCHCGQGKSKEKDGDSHGLLAGENTLMIAGTETWP